MSNIENRCLKWLTVDGFIRLYFEMIPDTDNLTAAYEAAERQYEAVFHRRKYSDYDTFRVTLTRWNKARCLNKINQ